MKNKQSMIILLALVLVVSMFAVVACDAPVVNIELKVTIKNKDALKAAWLEGDADRQLDVEVTVGETVVTDKVVVVSSSDSGVVSVGDDNKTLTAAGGGTATITVKVENTVTDSVEITVIPLLKAVSIKNKTELENVWVVGQADRVMKIEFNPDYYETNKPEYTVVSSDPTVVEVGADKATLSAKKLGVATITVAAGDIKDSVVINVLPVLESVSVVNKDELSANWTDWSQTRTIQLAFAPAEYYNAENTQVTVSCNPNGAVEADGLVLTAKQKGTATVTVTVADKTDSFTVIIERSVPRITIADVAGFDPTEEGGSMYTYAGNTLTLPKIVATTAEGDVISDVTLTASEGLTLNADERKVTSATKGVYQVRISVADPLDVAKVAEKTITVQFYRNLFGWQDGTWQMDNGYAPDEDQTVINTTNGLQLGAFNMDPTNYYYAEVTYNGPAGSNIGLANFVTIDGEEDHYRFLTSSVAAWGQYDYKQIDYDTSLSFTDDKGVQHSGWELVGYEWQDVAAGANYFLHSYRLTEYRGLAANEDESVHKIAILRLGTYFVTFWNDQYVNTVTLQRYAEPTRPGLFLGFGDPGVVGNITYFSGEEEVVAKYNQLTENGKNIVMPYVPDSWALGSLNNISKLSRNETTAEKGINFTYTGEDICWNDAMTSTYQLFDGNFSFSWTYTNSYSKNEGEPRTWLEVRSYKYGTDRTTFGAQYGGNGGSRWLFNTPNAAEQWNEAYHDFDQSISIRFTITRELTETSSKYTMSAYNVADPTMNHSRTIEVTPEMDERWDKAVIMHWKTNFINGEYSNIMWKNFNGDGNWVD